LDHIQGDAVAQPSLVKALCKEEGDHHQPNNLVGESLEPLRQGHRACDDGGGNRCDCHSCWWHGSCNDANDHCHENR